MLCYNKKIPNQVNFLCVFASIFAIPTMKKLLRDSVLQHNNMYRKIYRHVELVKVFSLKKVRSM